MDSASASLEQPRANLPVLGTVNATALLISRNIWGQTRALCGTHWEQPGVGLSAWLPSPPLFRLLPPFLHLPLPSHPPVRTCAGLAPFHLLPSPCSVPASQRSEDGATPTAVCRKVKRPGINVHQEAEEEAGLGEPQHRGRPGRSPRGHVQLGWQPELSWGGLWGAVLQVCIWTRGLGAGWPQEGQRLQKGLSSAEGGLGWCSPSPWAWRWDTVNISESRKPGRTGYGQEEAGPADGQIQQPHGSGSS